MSDQAWSNLEEQYLQLMRQRRFGEAADLLRAAHAKARQALDAQESAYISTLLASCLLASGKHEEALDALRQAREDDPSDVFLRLRTASLLLGSLRRPHEALEEIEPVAEQLLGMEETRHASLGVIGASYTYLGRIEDAVRCFREMLRPDLLRKMDPAAFDFFLVEALISRGEELVECRRYLHLVSEHARKNQDHSTQNRAEILLRRA